MHKIIKRFLFSFIICFFIVVSLSSNVMIAFASDGTAEKRISKGTIIFVMISVFIITTVIAGYLSYKVKVRKLHGKKDNSKDNK